MSKNEDNRAGDTSQRCGNSPAVSVSGPFVPKTQPPTVLTEDEIVDRVSALGYADAETEQARYFLRHIGYTHAKPYFKRFPPASFGLAVVSGAIRFDRQFQSLLMEYIGLFELQFRTQYAQAMASEGGAFAHRDPSNFKRQDWHSDSMRSYAKEANRQSRQGNAAVRAAIDTYGDLPVWDAVEVMSMGTLSKLFKNTRSKKVRRAVADSFGVKEAELTSWLGTISYVRNRCAHFGRLLGTKLVSMPKAIAGAGIPTSSPLYAVLILERLLSTDLEFRDDPTLMYSASLAAETSALCSSTDPRVAAAFLPPNWRSAVCRESIVGSTVVPASASPHRTVSMRYREERGGTKATE